MARATLLVFHFLSWRVRLPSYWTASRVGDRGVVIFSCSLLTLFRDRSPLYTQPGAGPPQTRIFPDQPSSLRCRTPLAGGSSPQLFFLVWTPFIARLLTDMITFSLSCPRTPPSVLGHRSFFRASPLLPRENADSVLFQMGRDPDLPV